ncbi:hypothetical protein LF41_751 [Lysobacter dokdonensis DS-58]|uniref:DUF6973 domain-containing protein n=1 Tax=Lysobacter dokdonensis DS-58 TaxID=1300345 RepID=A0A0A2WPL7_9GAMM|nr:hypothetical protein [Lysobacter dokdonensis]KGQ20215.1 hypothetical protein LF41_751 [Lysobacter dokdonensis DS-58]
MTARRRRRKFAAIAVLLLGAYPAFVLGTVYAHWFKANLPGGRNGPSDAYRHTLASATVAYTTSPRIVALVTRVMERDGQGGDMRWMDAHNNRIGARIGTEANSWSDMQARVRASIATGAVGATDDNQITWLPRERWQDRMY